MTATPANQALSPLAQSVTTLWGVGRERAAQLARLKISTLEDLLLHRPRRYEDRRHFRPTADLQLDQPATTRGTVVALGVKRFRHGQKSVFELILDDGTARLHCRWWNLPFMEKYFKAGDEVVVFGKPVSLKPRTMDHPETEVVERGEEHFIHFNRITPIYPLTEGMPQRWLRGLIWRTLENFESQIGEPAFGVPPLASAKPPAPPGSGGGGTRVPAPAARPNAIKTREPSLISAMAGAAAAGDRRAPLPARANAVHMIHFPEELSDVEIARQRLALDEFIALQWQIRLRRKNFEAKTQGLPCGGNNHFIKPFLAALGFKLTASQTQVLREIRADLRGPHPMRRLLQGDVGSGKTVVAACSALMAIESGYRAALMAPTEILAGQHFHNFSRWFAPLGIGVELLTGSRKTMKFETGSATDKPARPNLIIGTHTLIESRFAPDKLGLVVIDEQHKFGVAQREQLVRKGRYPHLLVMTATPIPRTLGLTVYGELDISVIDESPPGRGRIKTFVRAADRLPKVWSFLREKLAQGRQAYVVYPRAEEPGPEGIKAVTREFANLERLLTPFRVGLLHGGMKGREKDEIMASFRANAVQVLLATSLVEVGVDVPNATVMLVENAECFGLAQLHQLRGRIGRGAQDSYCILVSDAANEAARERLKVLEETTDGFRIAEADLQLRGPGELLGRQQSGMPGFRFGDLASDGELIRLARRLAAQLTGE